MANRVPQPQGDEVLRAYNRTYSRFALEHNVYCVPVDQVRVDLNHLIPCVTKHNIRHLYEIGSTDTVFRWSSNDSRNWTAYSVISFGGEPSLLPISRQVDRTMTTQAILLLLYLTAALVKELG